MASSEGQVYIYFGKSKTITIKTEAQAKQGCYYSNEALTFSALVQLKIMNHRVIGIQVLFLICRDRAGDKTRR